MEAGMSQMLGVKPPNLCNEAILTMVIHVTMPVLNHFIH